MLKYQQKTLTGSVAWVAGGSVGIGQAVVSELVARGATCISTARRPRPKDCQAHQYISADLSKQMDAKKVSDEIVTRYGGIDILVCCSGYVPYGRKDRSLEFDPETIKMIFEGNVLTVTNSCNEAVPSMISRKRGKIVIVGSSVVGTARPDGDLAAYSMAKAAIHQYTLSLARSVAGFNITVNCVAPGFIYSDHLKKEMKDPAKLEKYGTLDGYGRPEDVANCIAFLCEKDSDYITAEVLRVKGANISR